MVVASTGRLIAVVGATGAQGASVVQALVASSQPYRIRGLTRDTDSASSQKLAQQGVELSTASITEPAGIAKAIEEAEIVFVVTPPALMVEVRRRAVARLMCAGGELGQEVDRRRGQV